MLEASRVEIASLEAAVKASKVEVEHLTAELNACCMDAASTDEVAALKEGLASKDRELQESTVALDSLQEKVRAAEAVTASLREEKKSREATIAELCNKVGSLEAEQASLKEALTCVGAARDALETQLQANIAEESVIRAKLTNFEQEKLVVEERTTALAGLKEKAETERDDLAANEVLLRATITEQGSRMDVIHKANILAAETIENKSQQIAALEAEVATLTETQRQIITLESTVNELQTQINAGEEERHNLKVAELKTKGRIAELEADLTSALKTAEEACDETNIGANEHEAAVAKLMGQISQLEAELAKSNDLQIRISAEEAKSEATQATMETLVETHQKHLSDKDVQLAFTIAEHEKEVEELNLEMSELTDQLTEKASTLKAAVDRANKAESRVAELEQVSVNSAHADGQIADLRAELDEARLKLSQDVRYAETGHALAADLNRVRDDATKLRRDITARDSEINKLRGQLEQTQEECRLIRESSASALMTQAATDSETSEKKWKQTQHRITLLESELDSVQTRNRELEASLATAHSLKERSTEKVPIQPSRHAWFYSS